MEDGAWSMLYPDWQSGYSWHANPEEIKTIKHTDNVTY
jgi:hypothetical protein